MSDQTTRTIVLATAVAGTLDILAAIGLTLYAGRAIDGMLRFVASGPFPAATGWGAGGAVLGLGVHYTLMAVMVAAYVLAVGQVPALGARPWLAGIGYGLMTFIIMNLLVVPIRFGAWPPKPVSIVTQLFCHIVLVGIPIALIARRQ